MFTTENWYDPILHFTKKKYFLGVFDNRKALKSMFSHLLYLWSLNSIPIKKRTFHFQLFLKRYFFLNPRFDPYFEIYQVVVEILPGTAAVSSGIFWLLMMNIFSTRNISMDTKKNCYAWWYTNFWPRHLALYVSLCVRSFVCSLVRNQW